MTVKKIISDYRDHEFRNLPHLHRELDELNSYTEDYYIAQRDECNQKQRDEYYKPIKEEQTRREGRIGEMNENLRKYTEKYDATMWSHPFSPKVAERLIYTDFLIYKIDQFPGMLSVHTETNPLRRLERMNPKNIRLPDEPMQTTGSEPPPITDLEPFKRVVRDRIYALEQRIKQIKTETENAISTSQYEPILIIEGSGGWLYQNSVYQVTDEGSREEKVLLILDFVDKDRRKFERLKNKFSGEKSDDVKYDRPRIPENVRIEVWRRDGESVPSVVAESTWSMTI